MSGLEGLPRGYYRCILADPPWRFATWNKATAVFLREERADPVWFLRALSIADARRRRHRLYDGKALKQLINHGRRLRGDNPRSYRRNSKPRRNLL